VGSKVVGAGGGNEKGGKIIVETLSLYVAAYEMM